MNFQNKVYYPILFCMAYNWAFFMQVVVAQVTGLVRINPTEINSILPNPGMGLQSNNIVDRDALDAQGYPIKVAYFKVYWKDLEPQDGVYDFKLFNTNLARAAASGQKIALRIVVVDNITSAPSWLRGLGVKGFTFAYTENGRILNAPKIWTPDAENLIFQQRHFRFLRQLGALYNGHGSIDSIDIGSIGLWGEWNFWGTTPAVPLPSLQSTQRFIDAYFQSFPDTHLIAHLAPLNYLQYAVKKGAGLRGDCLGFIENQMKLIYEPNMAAAQAQDAWRNSPVLFETCWTIGTWVSRGYNLRTIFDWALARHVSAINNKNNPIPASAIPEFNRFLKKAGYRFVLRQLRYLNRVKPGQTIELGMDWENVGVAPCYGPYRLAVQFRKPDGQVALSVTTPSKVRDWMPGAFQISQSISLPLGLAKGTYTLALAVVSPNGNVPRVWLAISGRDSLGWYPMGSVIVE